jgi:hypothetical protein
MEQRRVALVCGTSETADYQGGQRSFGHLDRGVWLAVHALTDERRVGGGLRWPEAQATSRRRDGVQAREAWRCGLERRAPTLELTGASDAGVVDATRHARACGAAGWWDGSRWRRATRASSIEADYFLC